MSDVADVFRRSDQGKRAFRSYQDLTRGRRNGDSGSIEERFLIESVLVLLNRSSLAIDEAPNANHLEFYHKLFDWTDPVYQSIHSVVQLDRKSAENAWGDSSLTIQDEYIPPTWRKRLGEHYTPTEIVDYIVRHTIGSDSGKTLDPSVGTGAFALGWLRHYLASGRPAGALFEGYDVNPSSLAVAGLNIQKFLQEHPKASTANIILSHRDTLAHFGSASHQSTLFEEEADSSVFDFVIGNPPYVRVQNIQPMELRDRYRAHYPETAVGRFDLYMLFMEAACRALRVNGRLGFIVSNKFLTSNSGIGVRTFLSQHFKINRMVDLADSKLFQAAVLPLILLGTKGNPSADAFRYAIVKEASGSGSRARKVSSLLRTIDQLHEKPQRHEAIYSVPVRNNDKPVYVETFSAPHTSFLGRSWHISNTEESSILEKIVAGGTPLDRLCATVSAGIKTCADDVFINPITDDFIREHRLERECVKPYVQGRNISRWRITWTGTTPKGDTYVIYPHREEEGRTVPVKLSRIPGIAKWFSANREQLESRSYVIEAGRKWFEIWVPQRPRYFREPFKIVTPDFSTRNSFALDTEGRWCGGSAFMIVPEKQEEDWALFLLGVLNSSVLEYFHKKASSTFIYAGRYRYGASYLKRYPIPKASASDQKQIAKTVRHLIADPTKTSLEETLDRDVSTLFGIGDSGLDSIRATTDRKPSQG